MLAFTLAVFLLAGVLSALAPVWTVLQTNLEETLRESGRVTGGRRTRTQRMYAAVGVALVLLVAAGLMIRTLSALWQVDAGMQPDHALTFGLGLP